MTTDVSDAHAEAFEEARPRLFGIAYRMLGSKAEADDVVQDAWVRWQTASRDDVRDPLAFLATTTTRLALNVAQSARVRREAYVGPWLPEPVDTSADPALGAERGAALEVAILMVLEKLNPTERAAYILHEAFDYPYRDIAQALDLSSEENARQLASRARRKLAAERRATRVNDDERRRLLDAFVAAARDGDVPALERLLADDVVNYADGGGVVHAARHPFRGRERVARAIVGIVAKFWGTAATTRPIVVNGAPAILATAPGGEAIAVLTIEVTEDGIAEILWQVNPAKLQQFAVTD